MSSLDCSGKNRDEVSQNPALTSNDSTLGGAAASDSKSIICIQNTVAAVMKFDPKTVYGKKMEETHLHTHTHTHADTPKAPAGRKSLSARPAMHQQFLDSFSEQANGWAKSSAVHGRFDLEI